jgi:hypothetical protein
MIEKKLLLILMLVTALDVSAQTLKTENVILVTLDGFRWQELFNGAEKELMDQQTYLKDPDLRKKFWRETPDERRKVLLPFFWNTIAKEGQLYGNRALGCKVDVSNKMLFSYPGYNEILTGIADDRNVNSNDKKYNPNVNVLEFINSDPRFTGRVAAFSSWDVFPYIINDKRSKVYVSTGVRPVEGENLTERERMMNDIITNLPNPLNDVRLDAFTFYYALEYMKKHKPRVLYLAFDETDDFAHAGEYAAYLNSAHYTDKFIAQLWDYVQHDEHYKGKTTIIISVDHGRGTTAESWKHHGQKIPEASQIWFAVLGPDSLPMGEVKGECQYYQNQIAQTLASFLGMSFNANPGIGLAIPTVLARKQ